MTTRPTLPYGAWPSPISIDMAVGSSRSLSEPQPDGDAVYVLEARPEEAGRVALLRIDADGTTTDMAPELNVRTRVHEYGGGAYVVQDGLVVFSEFDDNRLMLKRSTDVDAVALTDDPAWRFAEPLVDLARTRVVAVAEDQRESAVDARNLLCAISLDGGAIAELATGHDFYASPRMSPDGARLAWLTWDFPQMPWDGSDLWVASFTDDGQLGEPVHVAGGPDEAVVQPLWAPDGSLVYVSDRSGWWNLYRWREGATGSSELAPMPAEFAGPHWVFGLRDLGIDDDGTIVAHASGPDGSRMIVLAPEQPPRTLDVDATSMSYVRVGGGQLVFVGSAPTQPTRVLQMGLSGGVARVLRSASELAVEPDYLSRPEHISYPTSGGRTSHAWFYPPTNPDVEAQPDELPPLVVMSHGGPTSAARTSLDMTRQAFTSRGFAVVDVNYGGSSGYGREYRSQLDGTWGEVDVDDCTNAALWLADQGLVDRARLAIRGGSAGGFTTLAALCFKDVFAAGTSFYGVADLEALTKFTHKFESRYLDGLLGPYPEAIDIYRERSPIHHVEDISCPVLVMQGADDLIVPQAQADQIVAALARKGLPHAYLLFEGEGHGFRQAVNQRRALEAELAFYAGVFRFELADDVAPLEIVGLAGETTQ